MGRCWRRWETRRARVMLEALETGVDGVVLRTNDPNEVRALDAMMREYFGGECAEKISLVGARVTGVSRVGAGDRCAVDASALIFRRARACWWAPSRAVYFSCTRKTSSVDTSTRVRFASTPVRRRVTVARRAGRRIIYPSWRAGSEILVVDSSGRARVANVARVKMERRSLVMIEAEHPDVPGTLAVLLQNAETCRRASNGRCVSVSNSSPATRSSSRSTASLGTPASPSTRTPG